jgi:tetratricopeptide (TPR) repeat protein
MLLRRCLALLVLVAALAGTESTPKAPPKAPDGQQPLIPQIGGITFEVPPFRFRTDVGDTDKERKAFAQRIMKPVLETTNYFLKVYGLKPRAFEDYAEYYRGANYEKLVRIDIWQDYESFRENFQRRYETKTIPGAFFGWSTDKDAYGTPTGVKIREIGTSSEGAGDEQLLRHLYHELGHLFMRTYMVVPVEVPSWIEEGTAELFQYRIGNGTKPEAERIQRQGWLTEIIAEGTSIPFPEFVTVRNLDNLDFTWKDPLRATLQYAQAWSVIDFIISNPARADAFMKMLAEFKRSGEEKFNALLRQGLKGDPLFKQMDEHLYSVQEATFKKFFGADLLNIETLWKEWVGKNYEKDLVKKPALRYHRGEWRLIRAEHAKKPADALPHLARAEELFRECMEKAPESPEGWVGMGRLHLMRGEHDLAWPEFAAALEKGSDNPEAMLYGGIARVQRGDAAAAVEPLAKVVADRPNSFTANYWYGRALIASRGDTSAAVTALSVAGGVEKERQGECSWMEGVAHLVGGRHRPAKLALLRALGQPGVPEHAIIWLAFATAAEGERAEAMTLMEKAPQHPDAAVLQKRLADNKPLPAIISDPHGRPRLGADADYEPVKDPKGKKKK